MTTQPRECAVTGCHETFASRDARHRYCVLCRWNGAGAVHRQRENDAGATVVEPGDRPKVPKPATQQYCVVCEEMKDETMFRKISSICKVCADEQKRCAPVRAATLAKAEEMRALCVECWQSCPCCEASAKEKGWVQT